MIIISKKLMYRLDYIFDRLHRINDVAVGALSHLDSQAKGFYLGFFDPDTTCIIMALTIGVIDPLKTNDSFIHLCSKGKQFALIQNRGEHRELFGSDLLWGVAGLKEKNNTIMAIFLSKLFSQNPASFRKEQLACPEISQHIDDIVTLEAYVKKMSLSL